MRQKAMAGAMLVAGAGAPAVGQVDGTATWVWDVVTEDGDAVVEVGETASVTLGVDLDPDVSYPEGPVLGFGAAEFDTLGGKNADQGSILGWALLEPFDLINRDLTTTDGVSLFGTTVVQPLALDVFSPADPIGILSFTWSPSVVGEYEVAYQTSTDSLGVYVGSLDGEREFVVWPVDEAEISFQVVPGPGGVAVLAAGSAWGAWGACGRRRGSRRVHT